MRLPAREARNPAPGRLRTPPHGHYGPCARSSLSLAGQPAKASAARSRKIPPVERRKVSVPIARRAHAFARRAAGRSQDPPRVPRKRPALPGAPLPYFEGRKMDGRTRRRHKEYGARSYVHFPFVPAKAGTQNSTAIEMRHWIPAFAGMNREDGKAWNSVMWCQFGALAVFELITAILILSSLAMGSISIYSHFYSHLLSRGRFDSALPARPTKPAIHSARS